jgi:FKBP-type peptidyl-prolyl cis-trans isomerase FkpA
MRKLFIFILLFLFATPAYAVRLKNEEHRTLYVLGVNLTKQLSVLNLSEDEYEYVIQGMTDVASGGKLKAEPEAYQKNVNQLFQKRTLAAAQKQKELSTHYLEKAVLEKNAQKTASGLIYQQISEGGGVQPSATDTVKVHYIGTFIDGKEFDNSIKRGRPAEFQLRQSIPCLTEGVGKMKVGGKARLICPSDIAYGDKGKPPIIAGGATIIFDIELLDVKKASPAAAPSAAPQKAATPKTKTRK